MVDTQIFVDVEESRKHFLGRITQLLMRDAHFLLVIFRLQLVTHSLQLVIYDNFCFSVPFLSRALSSYEVNFEGNILHPGFATFHSLL